MAKTNGKKCTCNIWMTLLALVLIAVGLYFIVGGFAAQSSNPSDYLTVIGWYIVGLIAIMLGKMCKWKGHMTCPVHGASLK